MHGVIRQVLAICSALLAAFAGAIAAADVSEADSVTGAAVSCQSDQAGCSLDVRAALRGSAAAPVQQASARVTPEQQFYRDLAMCRLNYQAVSPGLPQPAGPGGWYSAPCAGVLGLINPTGSPLMWIPNRAPGVSAVAVARTAEGELKLPVPAMASSPGAETPKVVNLPTWAWIGSASWRSVSATASVPGISVTATATPLYTGWSWGDGSFGVCRGPGTPYVRGVSDPAAASPDCGHTYRVTSKGAQGLRFRVAATIHWRITWRATTGQAGQFADMTSRAAQAWPVEEIDALNIPRNEAP